MIKKLKIFLCFSYISFTVNVACHAQKLNKHDQTHYGDKEIISKKNLKWIYTTSGKINIDELGFALTHEHIMSNFGADINTTDQYNEEALLSQVIPYLTKLKSLGVDAVFDCTTAYFGRRVDLLQLIADSADIKIVTNTGFYGAAKDKYIPEFALTENANQISIIWINEFEKGISGTEIKPGFIKLAFDEGTPSELDKKLFEAGVLTHLKTGLTIATHTSDNWQAIEEQLRILEKHGVGPLATVWVHANKVSNFDHLLNAAQKGVWISLDGVKNANIQSYISQLKKIKSAKLLHKVLLSHDGNSFPRGNKIRPYDAIMQDLIPAMKENGFTEKEIDLIMIENPKEAFAIRIRLKD